MILENLKTKEEILSAYFLEIEKITEQIKNDFKNYYQKNDFLVIDGKNSEILKNPKFNHYLNKFNNSNFIGAFYEDISIELEYIPKTNFILLTICIKQNIKYKIVIEGKKADLNTSNQENINNFKNEITHIKKDYCLKLLENETEIDTYDSMSSLLEEVFI